MQDTIMRVLRVSPAQSELFRRGYSRIFVTYEGESVIDSLMAAPSRPIENYIEAIDRAIIYSGLDNTGIELRSIMAHDISPFGAAHMRTTGWLKDEEGNAFDLFVQLDGSMLQPTEPNVVVLQTIPVQDGPVHERPLCMSVDIEDLRPLYDQNEDRPMSAPAESDMQQSSSNDQLSGGQGRVKNPDDGRLKENIAKNVHVDDAKGQPAMARQSQDDDEDGTSRRGRVRSPYDMRLKANRVAMSRQGQDDDDNDPPRGGSRADNGNGRQAGGQGTQQTAGRSSGNTASLGTWDDGSPRTVSALKKDGTPRKKPGPQVGTKYKMAA